MAADVFVRQEGWREGEFWAGRFFASRRRLERYCEEVQYNQSPQAAYSEIVL
jgi:hypothetical protein